METLIIPQLFPFQVAELFGGMEICGLSVVVAKDGKEHILAAHDSTFALIGDTQEEDRRQVADIVATRMQAICRPVGGAQPPQSMSQGRSSSVSSLGGSPTEDGPRSGQRPAPMGGPPPIPERNTPGVGSIGRLGSLSGPSSSGGASEIPDQPTDRAPALGSSGLRRDSQASQSSTTSSASRSQAATASSASAGGRVQSQSSVVEDAEDTMKNLRKTFAGIFGDM